uniref:Uncharacterized protein n=1 Tax=Oryza glumipatula TaxID=40148 RepID=A0A0D9ZHM5_9ORYZ
MPWSCRRCPHPEEPAGTTTIEERKRQWQRGDKTNNTVASGFGAFSRGLTEQGFKVSVELDP